MIPSEKLSQNEFITINKWCSNLSKCDKNWLDETKENRIWSCSLQIITLIRPDMLTTSPSSHHAWILSSTLVIDSVTQTSTNNMKLFSLKSNRVDSNSKDSLSIILGFKKEGECSIITLIYSCDYDYY